MVEIQTLEINTKVSKNVCRSLKFNYPPSYFYLLMARVKELCRGKDIEGIRYIISTYLFLDHLKHRQHFNFWQSYAVIILAKSVSCLFIAFY